MDSATIIIAILAVLVLIVFLIVVLGGSKNDSGYQPPSKDNENIDATVDNTAGENSYWDWVGCGLLGPFAGPCYLFL